MAQNSWPFENVDTTETQYSLLFDQFQDSGVLGDQASANALTVATSTAMGLTVASGFAIVRGFAYQNTSSLALTCDAATAQPRIDTVILRLDPSVNSIVAVIKKGTPSATPSAPALTQTDDGIYELPLANILIPADATALNPVNLTDRRRYLGATVGLWDTNSRPATPRKGRLGYNESTDQFEYWTGSAWTSSLPINVSIADGSITDAKLAVPPRRYRGVLQLSGTSLSTDTTYPGRLILTTATSAVTVNVGAGFAAGDRVDIIQDNTGQVTFVASPGFAIFSPGGKLKTKERYSAATLIAITDTSFRLVGDLVA